jgi:serine phosphatase RsbU (regulator of sigma subunit)/PAS domain-containing protein
MSTPLRVLILEDRPTDAEVMLQELRQGGFTPDGRIVDTEQDYVASLEPSLDLILADYVLPQFDAVQALQRLQERGLDIPFIIVSGNIGEDIAVAAMRAGAHDYVLKDKPARLAPAVWRELREAEIRRERRRAQDALREREARLRLLVEQMPALLWTTDFRLRLTSLQGAGVAALRVPPDDLLGQPLSAVFENACHRLDPVTAHCQALEGRSISLEVAWWERSFHLYVEPLRDAAGTITGCIGVGLDISERKRAQQAEAERLRLAAFTAEVGAALTQAPTLQDMLQRCATAMVHHLEAALARIWTFEPEELVLELQASAGLETRLNGIHGRIAVGSFAVGRIAQERRPLVTNDLAQDPRFADAECARQAGLVAFAGHPLLVEGQLVGTLALFARRPVTEFALGALAAAADSIALGIHRKRAEQSLLSTEEEFRLARLIQARLFPATAPVGPYLEIAGFCRSAQATGGDFYDYIPLPGEGLGVVIGDVTGHGFGPALLMASTRAYLRALAQTHLEVQDILRMANQVLSEDIEQDRFVTLAFVRLDPRTRSFEYASAGHLPGYVLDRLGNVKQRLEATGFPLGVLPDTDFTAKSTTVLAPGDMILLLTDGLVEARAPDGTTFGMERALEIIRVYREDPPAQIVTNLYHAVRAFSRSTPQTDDMTVVLIRALPTP